MNSDYKVRSLVLWVAGIVGVIVSYWLGYTGSYTAGSDAAARESDWSPLHLERSLEDGRRNADLSTGDIDWDESPEKTLARIVHADTMPTPHDITDFFVDWVKKDPEAAFSAARNLPGRFSFRGYLFPRMLAAALTENPEEALRWVDKLQPDMGGFSLPGGDWIGDPAETARLIENLSPGVATHSIVSAVARKWAKKDREAALKWGRTLQEELRSYALPSIMAEWARQDDEGALEYLRQASSAERQAVAANVLHIYGLQDPVRAIEWRLDELGTLENLDGILRAWAGRNIEEVSSFALEVDNPQLQQSAVTVISRVAAGDGLQEVSEWWSGLPENLRYHAIESSAGTLMRTDRTRFMDFVSGLPEEAITARLLDGMKESLYHVEPAAALKWSAGLPGATAERAAALIAEGWFNQNQAAAKKAVSALPEGNVRMAAMAAIQNKE